MKLVVFVELFLTLGVTFATEVKSNQSEPCYLSCAVDDLAKERKIFKAEVSDKKARVVNMTVSIRLQQTEGDACRNMSAIDVPMESYFVWAASAKEPYLYVPRDFLQVAQMLSLHYGRMDIRFQCTLQNTSLSPVEENGTMPALSDVVMKNLMHVMEITGTLCSSFTDYHSYKCCQMDETVSKITCSVIHPTEEWFDILCIIWGAISTFLAYYLPAVICLFPVWPRISKDGIRCIALRDPSPAAFRTLLVKLFVPENKDSLLNKARFFFLRAVLIPCMVTGFPFVLPCLIFYKEPFLYVSYALIFASSSIYAIFTLSPFTPSGPISRTKCQLCHNFLSEAVYHFHVGDTVKQHMYANLLGCVRSLRRFIELSTKLLNRLHSLRSFHSLVRIISSILLIGFVIPLVAIILLLFFAAYIPICLITLFLVFSPSMSIFLHEKILSQFKFQNCVRSIVKYIVALLLNVTFVFYYASIVRTFTRVFPYSILILIDDADAVFPALAFILPIVYYLHRCFTSFSDKYQRLKIKLFREIEKYRDGNERSLLLYTKTGAVAIPEELFEKACRDLHMPMLREFSVALFPIIGLSLFAFSVFASIMVYGASTGISPLVQTVTIFLASSIPTVFQLFSFGKTDEELKEIDDELRLETVVATYARRAQRDHDDESDEGGDAENGLLGRNAGTQYGSTSTTTAVAASIG